MAARSMAFGRTVAVRVAGRRFSREELRAGGSPHVGFSITLLLARLFFDLRFLADCCYFLVGIFGKGSSVFSILCRPAVFNPVFSLVPVVFYPCLSGRQFYCSSWFSSVWLLDFAG